MKDDLTKLDAAWPEPVDDGNRYFAGIKVFGGPDADLEGGRINYMLIIVAYDICDGARLRKVAKTCEQYGARVEKSVFHCDIPPDRFERLWKDLENIIDEEEDAVVAYRICSSCLYQSTSMGMVPEPEKRVCYIL